MPNLNCDENSMIQLRKAVINRYGKLYGFLKIEVNKALEERAKKLDKENQERGQYGS